MMPAEKNKRKIKAIKRVRPREKERQGAMRTETERQKRRQTRIQTDKHGDTDEAETLHAELFSDRQIWSDEEVF